MKTISKNIKKIKNLNSSIDLCWEEHILTMMVCSIIDMLRYFTVHFATSGHITIHSVATRCAISLRFVTLLFIISR